MRIKRFEAPDSKTALAMVKKELGEDAVILANKTLDAGTPRQRFEVVAAMDYDIETITVAAETDIPITAGKPVIYGYESVRRKKAETFPSAPHKIRQPEKNNAISFEANDLRMHFADLLRQQGIDPPAGEPLPPEGHSPPCRTKKRPAPEEVNRWRDQLIDQLRIDLPRIDGTAPVLLALTGPTGVGKTTTAAKIAAWYKLRENCKVALLSMDCYRIGATDQIRTYARIMQIPCEIVLRRNDLRKAIDRHRECDLIIIDTAGKSPYDAGHIDELSGWFSAINGIRTQLVLSATTKKEDLKHIMETYAVLKPQGLILTKLDETRAYATLCQQIAGAEVPISYLATGQRVPEDFYLASRSFLEVLFKQGWNAVFSSRTICSGGEAG